MGYKSATKRAYTEEDIQKAIQALQDHTFTTITAAAMHFKVDRTTLGARMRGRKTRRQANESAQILSPAEENTLIRWITRLTATGYPATPALLKEMAQEVRSRQVLVASRQPPPSLQPPKIGQE